MLAVRGRSPIRRAARLAPHALPASRAAAMDKQRADNFGRILNATLEKGSSEDEDENLIAKYVHTYQVSLSKHLYLA
jgi:hypothetical protein